MFKVFVVLLAAYVIGNLINGLIDYIFYRKIMKINKAFGSIDDISNINERINKNEANLAYHKKLIDQLYADRDEDINKIADEINRLDDIVSKESEE